jgi:hypothetical protein
MGIIDGSAALGHLHEPPPFERCKHHEQIGRAIALDADNRTDRGGRSMFTMPPL